MQRNHRSFRNLISFFEELVKGLPRSSCLDADVDRRPVRPGTVASMAAMRQTSAGLVGVGIMTWRGPAHR